MTTSPEDPDDTIAWTNEKLQEFEGSPEAASMNRSEHAGARAEIIVHGILRLEEPMRSDVASQLLAHLRAYLEA